MKIGRNDKCPCGSGKKYKRCHLHNPPRSGNHTAMPNPTERTDQLSPINEEGFLSDHIEEYRRHICQKHEPQRALLYEVNRFCQRVKFDVHVHNLDGQEIFSAALFIKILSDVQAAVLLLERGLSSQACSLLRVALEALIVLGKLAKSYDFVEAFIRYGEQQRLKLVRAIRQNPARSLDNIRPEITEEVVREIEQIVGDIPRRNLDEWACELGLSHFYDAQYRIYSGDIHSHPRALERYLETDTTGEYAVINWGPAIEEDLGTEFLESARILLVSLSFIKNVFELDIAADIERLSAKFSGLDTQIGDAVQPPVGNSDNRS